MKFSKNFRSGGFGIITLAVAVLGVSCKSKTSAQSTPNVPIQPVVANPAPGAVAQPAAAAAPQANPFASISAQVFLKSADFDVYDRSAVIRQVNEQVIPMLSARPEFYANFSQSGSGQSSTVFPQNTSTVDQCRTARLNSGGKIVSFEKEYVALSFDDATRCGAETQYSNKEIYYVRCVGVDLTSLKDKPAREIIAALDFKTGLCKTASEVHIFSNTKSLAGSPIANGADGYNQDINRAVMTSTGEPCVFKRQDKIVTLIGECSNFYLDKNQVTSVQNNQTKSYVDRKVLKKRDLVLEPESNQPWYNSGTIELSENGWSGTFNYANKMAPNASLRHEDGTTIVGTLTQQSVFQNQTYQGSPYGQVQPYQGSNQNQGNYYYRGTTPPYNPYPSRPLYTPCYNPNPRLSINFFQSGGQSAFEFSYSSGQTQPCYGSPSWGQSQPIYGNGPSYPSPYGNPNQTYVY